MQEQYCFLAIQERLEQGLASFQGLTYVIQEFWQILNINWKNKQPMNLSTKQVKPSLCFCLGSFLEGCDLLLKTIFGTLNFFRPCRNKRIIEMVTDFVLKWPIIILSVMKGVFTSVGDNSPFYNNCVKNCKFQICDTGKHSIFYYHILGFGFSLWSCLENCEYECQWKTVESFQKRNWAIPQFKGKWPFIRLFGFQEPASVIFSILNFVTVLKLLISFRKKVSKSSQYYYVWNIYALVQLNSWFWSSIYHSRDTDFTERMDYMSAFLVILYSFYAVGLRYINTAFNIKTISWSVICASIGINHLAYLWLYHFDYGYNMKFNCILGGVSVLLWFVWSFLHFNTQPFVWKIFLFACLVTFTTLLELLDFPPVLWLLDAHALWHGSTIFVNYIFYQFVVDDCNYLSDIYSDKTHSSHKKK